MTESFHDLRAAVDFTMRQIATWRNEQKLTAEEHGRIAQAYDQWVDQIDPNADYSQVLPSAEVCLEPLEEFEIERQRLVFLEHQIGQLASRHLLTDEQAKQLKIEVRARLAVVRDRLSGKEDNPSDEPSGRTFVEVLLDPRSLHIMMITGGALLVLGLVAWMWSRGVFENPLVVAVCLGTANFGLLAGGAAMVRYSRYQTAGRAVTLLACLVLPLNLWFYDAQGLITLKDGGHLWVPALVCCALYAAIARLLKDPLFVYALVAGISMTGLLFLADQQVDRFWEVIAPSTFLVVLGCVCVHAERLFREGDGPFSRQRFGHAFFVAGQIAMAVGLIVLLSGRLVGWFYEPMFADWVRFAIPDVAVAPHVKLYALLLAMLGTYTYIYSQLVVDARHRKYAYSAVMTLLWCEVILLDLLNISVTEPVLLLVLASTGLAAHVASTFAQKKTSTVNHLTNALGGVGAVCTAAAVVWGAVAMARGFFIPPASSLGFGFEPLYGVAMLVTAAACMVAAQAVDLRNKPQHAKTYLQALGLPLAGAAASGLVAAQVPSVSVMLPLLILVPLAMQVVASRRGQGSVLAKLAHPAYAATMFLLLLSIGPLTEWGQTMEHHHDHLLLAAFYAVATGLMGTTAVRKGAITATTLAGLSGCAAVWQLLAYAGFTEYGPMVAASAVGLATMLVARLRAGEQQPNLLAIVGAVLVTLGATAGLLMTMGRLLADEAEWALLGLAAVQAVAAVAASMVATSDDWKRTSRVLAGLHVLAAVLVVNALSGLTIWERGEIFTVAVGLLLLVVGHLRWRSEGESHDPLVDFNLLAGSLLAAGPLVFGLLLQRITSYDPAWGLALMHEVGALSLGLALVGAGVVCRIRATTLVGSGTLVLWVLSLVALLHLPELENAAIMMMVGGGVFFAVAVLLSVYRDRLLALPGKVRNREGVFRVLEWR